MFSLRLSRSTIGFIVFALLVLAVLLLSSVRVAGTAAEPDRAPHAISWKPAIGIQQASLSRQRGQDNPRASRPR